MTLNQTLISETTLNSTVASVTIPVPSGFTDIKLLMSARTTGNGTANNIGVYLNGSSSSYTGRYTGGQGNYAAVSSSLTGGDGPLTIWTANFGGDSTANTFANSEIYIPNYTASVNKTFHTESVVENNSADGRVCLTTTTWANTAAVTSIVLTPQTGSFLANSTFTLYGITKLGVTPTLTPKATGGDIIKNDGTYWYHAFLSTGAFIPQTTLSCDYLVVAGGGGGGWNLGGGGGAGGLVYATSQAIPATSQTISVGAGGSAGLLGSGTQATAGGNSTIGSLVTAYGGGRGGSSSSTDAVRIGGNGGSGGGADGYGIASGTTTITAGGAGTAGQGNNGGAAYGNNQAPYGNGNTGGGGGAGAVGGTGSNGSPWQGGNGGDGLYYDAFGSATGTGDYTSSHYYYAGGGGGASLSSGSRPIGGKGGGGLGGRDGNETPTAGVINTGGGGGGSRGNNGDGTAGGSGIVIIRYAMA